MCNETLFYPGTPVPKRLITQLDNLLDRRVATIIAPAGYNKSILIRTWSERYPKIHDRGINVIIQKEKQSDNIDRIAELVSNNTGTDPFLLIIDNHDRLKKPSLLDDIINLTESDPRILLIISGRNRPLISLRYFTLRGNLVTIDSTDLRLTKDESAELIRKNHIINDTDLDLIEDYFHGWPIATELIANSSMTPRWGHSEQIDSAVHNYINEEVLRDITPDDLSFLENLAVTTDITPQLAAHLTGYSDASARLTRLAATGIPLEWTSANTIGMNPALHRYLLKSLHSRGKNDHHLQSHKAVTWLHHHGRSLEAIDQAVSAQDHELAYDIATELVVEKIGKNLKDLPTWFDELSHHLPPSFLLGIARVFIISLTSPEMLHAATMSDILSTLPRDANYSDRARMFAMLLKIASISNYTTQAEIINQATDFAKEVLNGEINLRPLEKALVLEQYGLYLLAHGEHFEAREVMQIVMVNSQLLSVSWLSYFAQATVSYLQALIGKTNIASRLANEILDITKESNHAPQFSEFPLMALATITLDRGDTTAARTYYQTLQDLLPEASKSYLEPLRVMLKALILQEEGSASHAITLCESYRASSSNTLTPYQSYVLAYAIYNSAMELGDGIRAQREIMTMQLQPANRTDLKILTQVCRARLEISRAKPETAMTILRSYIDDPNLLVPNKHYLKVFMTYGVAANQIGDSESAMLAFQRAGVIAERLGLNNPGALHTRSASSIRRDQIPLTAAERQVLKHIASDFPLREVAAQLFITQNTLKTHLRRIYKKMNVGNRAEAIAQARALGIV
ncbi:MAG: LuxR C-terminal-related transcriptional regulator [Propionibacteriaceae bacterium]